MQKTFSKIILSPFIFSPIVAVFGYIVYKNNGLDNILVLGVLSTILWTVCFFFTKNKGFDPKGDWYIKSLVLSLPIGFAMFFLILFYIT